MYCYYEYINLISAFLIILFLFMQKYFVEGVQGAVKG